MRVFLDLLPGHDPADRQAVLAAGGELVEDRGPGWVEVGDPAAIRDLPPDASLWLRGTEAGGPTGSMGTLTLIRAAVASGRPWVASGLGPGASAAAVALGAAGVVVEVGAWLLPGSPLCPEHRDALIRSHTGRDTTLHDGQRLLRSSGSKPLVQGWWRNPGSAVPAPQSVGSGPRACPDGPSLVRAVREAVAAHLALVASHHPLRPGSDPLGSGRPLVQGPMANVAERPGLARAVAAAGAMPFAALGALDPDQARQVLDAFAKALPDRPWGVGVIGFEMMPHRDAHLEAIAALGSRGPSAVTLAGGSPALAAELRSRGLKPWLHTPSAPLLLTAADRGVSTVILEGRDAGGHVGALTSVGLWEEGLQAATGRKLTVVLAGGISDPVTAAFASAMAAPAVASGVAVALQAGTAFLFSHEVCESGQLTPVAQQAGLAARSSVLVGSSVNLPLRCVPSPFAREATALEHRWLAEGIELSERRARMEALNLGRSRIGAKGIERDPESAQTGRRYRPVPTARQRAEAAFPMGEGAALTSSLSSVAEIVDRLSTDAAALLGDPARAHPWPAPEAVAGRPRTDRIAVSHRVRLGGSSPASDPGGAGPIAIVGLGCVLPGAPDVDRFWHNLVHAVDGIRAVPESRWPAHRYFDPHGGPAGSARSIARAAGVVGELDFDPQRYRIPPAALPTVDPVQRMALLAADQAVTDAGWIRPDFDRSRAAVILGNSMGGEHAKSLALRVRFRDVLAALESEGALDGLDPDVRDALFERVEARLDADLPPIAPDSMTGLLANVIAGRVASWLDWMGGNLTVDAACAASLASVAVAVDWLRTGRCDAVLAGGVDADLSPETFVGFSRTRALSPGRTSPFSERADGFTMGEGAAVLALRRLDDALAAGEPIYAVLRGVGQSSDGRGRGLSAPRPAGQQLAIQRAWAEASLPRERLALIEAHGTGTAIGDATEVGVWQDWLGPEAKPVWIGTVKASIGHLKGGAGAAGLLKTTLALAAGVAPPTLQAAPLVASLRSGPVRPVRLPTAVPDDAVAGVSAFGFGGTNFHVVLDRAQAPHPRAAAWRALAEPLLVDTAHAAWSEQPAVPLLLCFGAKTRAELLDAVHRGATVEVQACARAEERCTVLCDPRERAQTLERVRVWLESAPPRAALGATAFCGSGPAEAAVLLCPGQGAQRHQAPRSLQAIPAGSRGLHEIGQGQLGLEPLGSSPVEVHRALVPLAIGWHRVLEAAELPVAATVGHSLGEIGALVAAGRLTPAHALALAEARGAALEACEPGSMLATDLQPEQAVELARAHGLAVAALNSPRNTVLSGSSAACAAAATAIGERGARARLLRVERAYHSPAVASAVLGLDRAAAELPLGDGRPWWSASHATSDIDPRAALGHALGAPVRFAEVLTALEAQGHRLFVELGPGRALCGFASDTLPGSRAIALDPSPGDHGLGTAQAAAALLAEGHPGLVHQLPATLIRVALVAVAPAPARRARSGKALQLQPTPRPPTQRHEAPRPRSTHSEDPIRDAVVHAVSSVSGYPADFLRADAELEAELGVDSIRKLEILGRLEDQLGFRAAESDYRELEHADIDSLTEFVRERLDHPAASGAPARPTGPAPWAWIPESAGASPPAREPLLEGLTAHGSRLTLHRKETPELSRAAFCELLVSLTRGLTAPQLESVAIVGPLRDPLTRAAAALARSACRERGLHLRVVLGHPDVEVDLLAAAAWDPGLSQTVEVRGSRVFHRRQARLAIHPVASEGAVLWATGGVAGIAGSILEALAADAPRIAVLGRSDPGGETARDRAHGAALQALKAAGLTVHWVRCDLADGAQVRRAVRRAMSLTGPPDLVLHAAGATADAALSEVEGAHLHRALDPKWVGLNNLRHALPDARWLLFSSVAATRGNLGQAAYAAANGALHGPDLRGTTVALGPWADRGMAADPVLQAVLRRRGVVPIDLAEGAAAMADLVRAALVDSLPRELALLGQAPPDHGRLPAPLGDLVELSSTRIALRLEYRPDDPDLDHHRVAGRPLVPAALHLSAFLAAAEILTGPGPQTLLDFAVEAPTFVDRPRTDLLLVAQLEAGVVLAEVRAGTDRVAHGRVERAPRVEGPQLDAPGGATATPPYGRQLFHGPRWQVLGPTRMGPHGASAAIALGDPAQRLGSLADGVHQLLSWWSGLHGGQLGLPVAAARWTVDSGDLPEKVTAVLRAERCPSGARADVVVCGPDGEVVAHAAGLTLRDAAPWTEPVDV